jgi:methyl-accepting chemotaxis protein
MKVKMNLKAKMLLYFSLVVVVAVLGFFYTIWRVSDAAKLIDDVKTQELPRMMKVKAVQDNASSEVSNIRAYYMYKDQNFFDAYKKAADENSKIEEELINDAATEEEKKALTAIRVLGDKFSDITEKEADPLIKAEKNDEALQLLKNMVPIAKDWNAKLDEYKKQKDDSIANSLDTAVATGYSARLVALIAAIFAAVLGMLIGFFAARSIARPIDEISLAAHKVAAGDLTEQVYSNRQDEIGDLAAAFNAMVLNLKKLIEKVTVNAEQVAASSEELTANSEQSTQATMQIATSITDVAAGAAEQTETANSASAVVEQMSAGIQQIAANASHVAESSSKVTDKARNGDRKAEEAVSQMNKIENTVNSSAQVIAKLGERSKEIGQIVDTISEISGQTNLLALNAAIEAARAGEHGKGFAVVAEEIRKLAEQSQGAAQRIADLIGQIQGETEKAVIAMNEGTQEVKIGAKVIHDTGIAFKEIMGAVGQVTDEVKAISTAIQQMASGSQQIVVSVKKIDELSKKSAGETQGISAATEEQLASMEEISTSSQALAKLAGDLQASVMKFRI